MSLRCPIHGPIEYIGQCCNPTWARCDGCRETRLFEELETNGGLCDQCAHDRDAQDDLDHHHDYRDGLVA